MLGELPPNGSILLCDMEAGIGTVLRLQPGQIDVVLVVAEPSAKGIDVAARCSRIAESRARVIVVANKARDDSDVELVRRGVGDPDVVVVPADPAVEEADRRGVAPIDLAPDSPAVAALTALAADLGAR